MTIKTIKNVDNETWYKFKNLAIKYRVGMGELLGKMVVEYEQDSKEFWKNILTGEKILSDKEANELLNQINRLRKEKGFRI